MWYSTKLRKYSIGFVLTLVLIRLLTSCASNKYVPTPIYVTDTTKSSVVDSTLNGRFINAFESLLKLQQEKKETSIKETTHEKDSVAPRYDAKGNKTGEDHYHSKVTKIESKEVLSLKETISHLQHYKDSTAYLMHKIDSLTKVNDKTTPYYIEKKLNVVHRIFIGLGMVFLFLVSLYVMAVIVNVIKKNRSF